MLRTFLFLPSLSFSEGALPRAIPSTVGSDDPKRSRWVAALAGCCSLRVLPGRAGSWAATVRGLAAEGMRRAARSAAGRMEHRPTACKMEEANMLGGRSTSKPQLRGLRFLPRCPRLGLGARQASRRDSQDTAAAAAPCPSGGSRGSAGRARCAGRAAGRPRDHHLRRCRRQRALPSQSLRQLPSRVGRPFVGWACRGDAVRGARFTGACALVVRAELPGRPSAMVRSHSQPNPRTQEAPSQIFAT